MTKAEIIEAINATIVPNKEKAITAELLANLLIEMANATPEGGGSDSGSGILTLILGDIGDGSDLTAEDKAHNAEVYNQYMTSATPLPVFAMGYPLTFSDFNSDGTLAFSITMILGSDPSTNALMGMVFYVILSPDGNVTLME